AGFAGLRARGARAASPDPFAAGEPDWVTEARAQIPAARELRYFQTGGIGVCPGRVIDRVKELLDHQNRGPADPRFANALPVGEDVVANVLRELRPRTRLVAMSHVSRRNGRVIPARELAAALRRRSVRLLLDGAQAAGNVPVRFHDLGCDYYSLCGHKWLLGP